MDIPCVPHLGHEYWMSRRGDGTVMGGSANGNPDLTSYYVELSEYNRDDEKNYKHMNMLSAPPIQKLLRAELLNDTEVLPEYVSEEEGLSDTMLRWRFRVYSPVDIHLTDGEGNHTGVTTEVNGEMGRSFEEEVPNSYYLEWDEVKYGGADGEQGPLTLALRGTGSGTFRLEVDRVSGDEVQETIVFDAIPVTAAASGTLALAKHGSTTLVYDIDGNGVVDARIAPGTYSVPPTIFVSALRDTVRTSHMPQWLKVWINARIALVDLELKKGRRGNLGAAQAILKTVVFTLDRQTPTLITQAEHDALNELLGALMQRIKR
jgi:hypothetical protein